MLHHFIDNKGPAITVQGVLLASSILYLEHGGSNLPVVFAVILVLSLFFLQAINHRFFYYFPGNKFTGKETRNLDTYVLYSMTFLSVWLFIWGISHSFVIGIISVLLIVPPGFLWKHFILEKVRKDIANRLRSENIVEINQCPKCGAKAIIGKKVFKWNLGYQIIECVDGCGFKYEGYVPLNIG
jgi:hypothetical protein